jgi:hypothetical protein
MTAGGTERVAPTGPDAPTYDPDAEPRSRYADRVAALLERAREDRTEFDPDAGPERALAYLRDGAGQAVWVYVEARTGGRTVWLPPAELAALRWAMNSWLELYAACHGREVDAAFSVRGAAELLLDTRNVVDLARILTGVPER